MAGFRTLRQRQAGAPDPNEVLPLKVLPYMRQPLMDWADSCIEQDFTDYPTWAQICQLLKIDYTNDYPHRALINALNQENDLLLDLIDARLQFGVESRVLEPLKIALHLAGSGWRLSEDERSLEQVVQETVRTLALSAIQKAEASAAAHLKAAWSETYGRDKNPTQAHAEMIRAVESAARPVVTPKDKLATLGTMIGQMNTQGQMYTTLGASDKNDGIPGIVSMMRLVWEQQTDRHGANPTIPSTQGRVELLLPVAAALVHAFSTGGVRLR